MVYQPQHSTPSVTTRAVPLPSSKQPMVKSSGGIQMLPGRAVLAIFRPTSPSCLRSQVVAFHIPAK